MRLFEHFRAMATTTLFRTRIPTARLRNAEKILAKLGMKPGDAFNIFLAQVEIQKDFPIAITAQPGRVLSTADQGKTWETSLGAY
jgi:antitoxin component of RelBE/YafQ-DinJ toxin-antitoxin module